MEVIRISCQRIQQPLALLLDDVLHWRLPGRWVKMLDKRLTIFYRVRNTQRSQEFVLAPALHTFCSLVLEEPIPIRDESLRFRDESVVSSRRGSIMSPKVLRHRREDSW